MSASLRPGVTAGIVGYTLGYLSFQLELFPFRSSAALGSSAPIKSTKFLKQVKVVGYSVLGSRLENGKFINVVGAPQAGTALVDPAGLPYVSGQYPPGKAGAASKAIYSWVGLRDAAKFPDAVSAAITKPGDAKAHTYGGGQSDAMSGAEVSAGKSVVHVVGPDFRSRPHTDAEALASLTRAYGNVLREIATLPASVPRVRLLPISGGVFLGGFKPGQ